MKKFLKNTVKEINATTKFISAGLDIPLLKKEIDCINAQYVEIVEKHNNWKKFATEIENFNFDVYLDNTGYQLTKETLSYKFADRFMIHLKNKK